MKPYISVMQEFIGRKFGRLSSELLIKKYMKQMGIGNLLALTHEQQVRFANFFIAQVLQRHMDKDRIDLMKQQLFLTYCLDNALETVGKDRQKVVMHVGTAQIMTPRFALEGKDKNDLFFSFSAAGTWYVILSQEKGVQFLNGLGGSSKELFDVSMYGPWKTFLEATLNSFCALYEQHKHASLSWNVPDYSDAQEHIQTITSRGEDMVYAADVTLGVQDTQSEGRILYVP